MGLTALFVFIAIIVIPLIFLSKKNGSPRGDYVKIRWAKWLFGGYVAVLLLSVVLYPFIPIENALSTESPPEEYIDKKEQNFFETIYNGRMEEIDPEAVERTFAADYHNEQLHIAIDRNQALDAQVLLERKAVNDHKIEGTIYKPLWVVRGMDISAEVKPLEIKWSDDTLMIMNAGFVDLNYALFKKEFPITQFTGEDWFDSYSGGSMRHPILYLQIPKDLEIIDLTNGYVDFITE